MANGRLSRLAAGHVTFVIPVAFATTVPAQALNGQARLATLLAPLAAASGLLAVSRVVWLRGLRRYSGGIGLTTAGRAAGHAARAVPALGEHGTA